VAVKLLVIVQNYLDAIAKAISGTRETAILLMHNIVHRLYCTFETEHPSGFEDLSAEGRNKFETYLITQCINPTLPNGDPKETIDRMRDQTMINTQAQFWMKRVEQRFNAIDEECQMFEEQYLASAFLPFQIVTLAQFKWYVLKNPANQTKYPVLFAIAQLLNSSDPISLFALQHLPAIVQWMKLVHLHYNYRLTETELSTLTAADVLELNKRYQGKVEPEWADSWRGFVQGWNFMASNMTGRCDNHAVDTLNISFPIIKSSEPNGTLSPKHLPLAFAVECSHSFGKALRLLLEHLVQLNNSCLLKCYRSLYIFRPFFFFFFYSFAFFCFFVSFEKHQHIGEIALTHISNKNDVVALDETVLLQLTKKFKSKSVSTRVMIIIIILKKK
ncbi:hypothetical protein RFI_24842, partial [Reticulomyxa filosa]